jgi:hypothetical protein
MFRRLHPGKKIEVVSIDTRDGSATASIYDIMQHPAFLALRDDGSTLRVWQGKELPLMDEVVFVPVGRKLLPLTRSTISVKLSRYLISKRLEFKQ